MERVDSGRFFEDKILSNYVVTDQIFRYISKSEILACSLISKKWISSCRESLRRHHECLLRLDINNLTRKLEHTPSTLLESVLVTSKLLDDCNEIFYNGIFWNISVTFKYIGMTRNDKEDIAKTFKVVDSIFKRLPKIQFLTLDTHGWANMGYSPFSRRRHCPNLTEIEKLTIIRKMPRGVYNAFFGQQVFSSLKLADIHVGFGETQQRVLTSSPVLQEWLSEISQFDIKYFAQANKLVTIKRIQIDEEIQPDIVDQIEASNLTLERLTCYMKPSAKNVENFRRITSSSTASLQKVELDYDFCRMLITTPKLHPFNNVKVIILLMDDFHHEFVNMEEAMEGDNDAQRIFPNANFFDGVYSN